MSFGMVMLLGWLGGWLASVVPVARWLLRTMCAGERIDQTDRLFAAGIGMLLALFWPLILPVRYVAARLATERSEHDA